MCQFRNCYKSCPCWTEHVTNEQDLRKIEAETNLKPIIGKWELEVLGNLIRKEGLKNFTLIGCIEGKNSTIMYGQNVHHAVLSAEMFVPAHSISREPPLESSTRGSVMPIRYHHNGANCIKIQSWNRSGAPFLEILRPLWRADFWYFCWREDAPIIKCPLQICFGTTPAWNVTYFYSLVLEFFLS